MCKAILELINEQTTAKSSDGNSLAEGANARDEPSMLASTSMLQVGAAAAAAAAAANDHHTSGSRYRNFSTNDATNGHLNISNDFYGVDDLGAKSRSLSNRSGKLDELAKEDIDELKKLIGVNNSNFDATFGKQTLQQQLHQQLQQQQQKRTGAFEPTSSTDPDLDSSFTTYFPSSTTKSRSQSSRRPASQLSFSRHQYYNQQRMLFLQQQDAYFRMCHQQQLQTEAMHSYQPQLVSNYPNMSSLNTVPHLMPTPLMTLPPQPPQSQPMLPQVPEFFSPMNQFPHSFSFANSFANGAYPGFPHQPGPYQQF